jgi:hypothetical protein
MSDLPSATRGADQLSAPKASGTGAGTATSTTTSAASLDLSLTRGGAWYSFQARGGDVYVRFGSSATTATTSGDGSNGYKIPDGQTAHFWLTPADRYVDHICSAASKTLFWWQSSPNYDNR